MARSHYHVCIPPRIFQTGPEIIMLSANERLISITLFIVVMVLTCVCFCPDRKSALFGHGGPIKHHWMYGPFFVQVNRCVICPALYCYTNVGSLLWPHTSSTWIQTSTGVYLKNVSSITSPEYDSL